MTAAADAKLASVRGDGEYRMSYSAALPSVPLSPVDVHTSVAVPAVVLSTARSATGAGGMLSRRGKICVEGVTAELSFNNACPHQRLSRADQGSRNLKGKSW